MLGMIDFLPPLLPGIHVHGSDSIRKTMASPFFQLIPHCIWGSLHREVPVCS